MFGSVGQVTVTGAPVGASITLLDGSNDTVETVAAGVVDTLGSFVFRKVQPGSDYRVTTEAPLTASAPVTVPTEDESMPKPGFYADQELQEGFTYITARDGTRLSASVYLPAGPGPFPTVVEYSGYNPADPTQDLIGTLGAAGIDAESLCDTVKIVCKTPAQPSSLIAAAMGYAVVAVNVRGTGCSGGSFDFFERLQLLDGYDVIEAVAAQPWVRNNKVGMVGLSYPGISQLFVASTAPPSLAAIAPLSVYDDTVRGVLAPGGIFNDGFALEWAGEVLDRAAPFGQGWEQDVVDGGDTTCLENQRLRGQNVDPIAKAQRYRYYDPAVGDPLNLQLLVPKINVPVFMTGAWQDEQTGPRFVNLWDKFTSSPVTKFTAFNGAHADGYSAETLAEWKIFLDLYVAGERTPMPSFARDLVPQFIGDTLGGALPFPPERLLDGTIADQRARYEAEPPITILWERGADEPLGATKSTGRMTLPSWPPPGRTESNWFLGSSGDLAGERPDAGGGGSTLTLDPSLAEQVTLPGSKGGQAFDALPEWEWRYDRVGNAAVFISPPLPNDLVLLGGGVANLWVRSSSSAADLAITLSEVRPDGMEMYVQSGVQRGEMRTRGPDATAFDPRQTGFESDASPLVPGEWTEFPIELLPVGHVFRAGSRLRLSVHTPGGDKPRWAWILDPMPEPVQIDIGHDAEHASELVLPALVGATGYRQSLPPCPSLRGQPCRQANLYRNQPASTG